jgi:hypothetical protein
MSNFPSSAEQFYALRDDRTNRCSINRNYQKVKCAVHLSPTIAATAAAWIIFTMDTLF